MIDGPLLVVSLSTGIPAPVLARDSTVAVVRVVVREFRVVV